MIVTETRLGLPNFTAKMPFFILARMAIQEAIPNLDFGGGETGRSYPDSSDLFCCFVADFRFF